jgi:acyl carrier protein
VSPSEAAPPTREDVFAELRSLMQSAFDLKPQQIEPTTHLIDDLDLDSIDLIDLAVSLEERSGLKLGHEELNSVKTVEDAVDVIHAALVRRSAGDA